jgi:sec-independent protein translocase protein TatB
MFDVGFAEVFLIGIVALVVIGPERLPAVAKTVGQYVGKLQRFVRGVKTDLASELESGDLKKLIGDQREQINELRDMVSTAKKDFQSTTQSVIKNTKEGLEELETSVNDARRDVAEVAETQAPKSTPSAIETQTSAASDSAASQSSADNDTTPAKTSDKSSDNRGDKTGKDTASPTTKRSGTTDSGTP